MHSRQEPQSLLTPIFFFIGFWNTGSMRNPCGKYSGVISVFVCNEIFHRVMFAEFFKQHNIDSKHAIKYLKDNPDVLKELWAPGEAIKNIEQIENLKIVGVGRDALDLALKFLRSTDFSRLMQCMLPR
jgi:hypothetical protein